MNLGRDLAAKETLVRAGLSATSAGECVEVDFTNNIVVVNIGGGEVVMPWVSEPPMIGDRVQVGYLGQTPICLGPKYGSVLGTAQTVSSGIATVQGDDGVMYRYVVPPGVAVATANRVRLDHAGRLVAAVVAGTPPPPDEPVAPPKPPAAAVKSLWFTPTSSGNYRYGNFQSGLVEISDTRTGVYWYGTQIRDSIPNSATILECKIVLRQNWDEVPGVDSRMQLHTQTKPGGPPSLFGGPWSIPGGSRTVGLSVPAFADLFKSGAAFGVGFEVGAGWRQYASAATSGQLFFKWRT